MPDFELTSTKDGVRLMLSPVGPRTYSASIAGRNLNVSTTIHDVLGEIYVFPKFWEELASSWKGWSGERTWSSLEGDLKFTATSDNLGHITIRCHLSSGGFEGWSITVWLHCEAGALDSLARKADRFARSIEMAV